ncbi:MAG: hypothetical protein ACXAAM_05860 [Candidatus Heimdallarchaeaceae archaeon]
MLLILLFSKNQLFFQSRSQFEYFPEGLGIASLIPYPGHDGLSLLESSIIMSAELEDMNDFNMPIVFNCSYMIYNPTTTINASFLLPITYDFYNYNNMEEEGSIFTVWVNETRVELFYVLDNEFEEEIEEELGYSPHYRSRSLNASEFQSDSVIHIEILGEILFSTSLGRIANVLSILYDLRTLHHWGSYFKQKVEFRIDGLQPSSFSNYSDTTPERKCLVTHYETGSSYFWNWENEQIVENKTQVQWEIPREKPFTFLVNWDFYSILLLILSSSLIVFINKNRRKRYLHE